ncbi:hypothetical protein CTZ27_31450 [Streptomyces griseocarneus]|nr:hypothetical protein CTZ27_31450 [Streptomyces griseocarneus]
MRGIGCTRAMPRIGVLGERTMHSIVKGVPWGHAGTETASPASRSPRAPGAAPSLDRVHRARPARM